LTFGISMLCLDTKLKVAVFPKSSVGIECFEAKSNFGLNSGLNLYFIIRFVSLQLEVCMSCERLYLDKGGRLSKS
jgi:hypothetical protein